MIVIFDLDGTLCNIEHRLHFINGKKKDWMGFYKACPDDAPNEPVIKIFQSLEREHTVWIFSGRGAEARYETERWLLNHDCWPDQLLMRPEKDYTSDVDLKQGWLNNMLIDDIEEVMCVFDDRQKVVDMWRSNGITCLQVAPGDF